MSGARRRPRGGPPGPAPPASGQGGELVLATRGSDLALAQTRLVGAALAAAHPGIGWRLLTVATRGDRSAGAPGLPSVPARATRAAGNGGAGSDGAERRVGAAAAGPRAGGEPAAPGSGLAALARVSPGVFTSEVAAAVARGAAAAAVHSLKDLPLDGGGGLYVAAIPPRAAAGDALVTADGWVDAAAPLGLRGGATVGTSSPRRAALLRTFAPQVRVVEVRGNVPTRLRRCRDGELAAVVLAQAGLQRLGASLAGLRLAPLPPEDWQPAPGQGALAVQARRDGTAVGLLAALDHAPTRTAVALERQVLRALGGGCAAPCGAYARPAGEGEWELHYGVADSDGGGWKSYRLRGSGAGCRSALDAWAAGGPRPGEELPAAAAQDRLAAVLFGTR